MWARSELGRLGLTDWTVKRVGSPSADQPCSSLSAHEVGTVKIGPSVEPDALYSSPEVAPVVDELRREIGGRCLPVEQARSVVDEALASLDHHWPSTTVVDASAECARADLTVGGSLQVTVYGPTSVG